MVAQKCHHTVFQNKAKSHNCAEIFNQTGRKVIFVFKLILYTLGGVTYEKIALVVQYCLKCGGMPYAQCCGPRIVRGPNCTYFFNFLLGCAQVGVYAHGTLQKRALSLF